MPEEMPRGKQTHLIYILFLYYVFSLQCLTLIPMCAICLVSDIDGERHLGGH